MMNRRRFIKSMGAAGLGAGFFRGVGFTNVSAQYQARTARDFLDSIGVAVHWNYSDTPYGFDYARVRDRLIESGITHVRDGFSNRIQELGENGITSTVVADLANNANGSMSDIENIRDRIKKENQNAMYVDAVEGPNEVDLFWERFQKTYEGDGYKQGQDGIIKGAVHFQKDLYGTLKTDSETEQLTVLGIALGRTYDPGGGSPNPFQAGELTDFVDLGNFHPYPGGGNPFSYPAPYAGIEKYYWQSSFPSINLDEYPYAFDTYHPPYAPKPMACTETGYSTYANGASERTHAKYIPRLYAEYFRLGIQRAYVYEFIDEFQDPQKTNREAHFGLLRRDTSPKPGYTALKNLIALLKDDGPDFEAGTLEYLFRRFSTGDYTKTNFVHQLLLQKSDGDFYLLIWHEISAEDVSKTPHKELEHPDMPVELVFKEPVSNAVIYRYNEEMAFESHAVDIVDDKIELTVPDQILVVRITPGLATVQRREHVIKHFRLFQNVPNPFNPNTTIVYDVPTSSHVSLHVYDVRGRLLQTLVDEKQSAGRYIVPFANPRLPSGTYVYRLTAGEYSAAKRMQLIR